MKALRLAGGAFYFLEPDGAACDLTAAGFS